MIALRVAPRFALVLSLALAAGACGHRALRSTDRYVDASKMRGDAGDASPSDCADDAREEDDRPADVLGKIVTGPDPIVWKDQVSCPGDDDLVHGFSDGTRPAGALVTWNAADGELRVDLLGPEGSVLALDGSSDATDRQPGRVELTAGALRGDFYVRVRNVAGTRIPYAIEIRAPGEAPAN